MNEIKIFENEQFGQVRTVVIDGEPWFVGKDVAEILGYSETNAMTKRLDRQDFISDKLSGMNMKSTLVNESGLYDAIFGSKLPEARPFKRWVTADVLPTLRKTGKYEMPKKATGPRQEKLASVNMAAKTLTKTLEAAGVPATFIAVNVMNLYRDKAGIEINAPIIADQDTPKLYGCEDIAKEIGIYSKSGLPHKQAVATIIGFLDITEEEIAKTPFDKNGHAGITTQYKPCVLEYVESWLMERNYPKKLFDDNGKCYSVVYQH